MDRIRLYWILANSRSCGDRRGRFQLQFFDGSIFPDKGFVMWQGYCEVERFNYGEPVYCNVHDADTGH